MSSESGPAGLLLLLPPVMYIIPPASAQKGKHRGTHKEGQQLAKAVKHDATLQYQHLASTSEVETYAGSTPCRTAELTVGVVHIFGDDHGHKMLPHVVALRIFRKIILSQPGLHRNETKNEKGVNQPGFPFFSKPISGPIPRSRSTPPPPPFIYRLFTPPCVHRHGNPHRHHKRATPPAPLPPTWLVMLSTCAV